MRPQQGKDTQTQYADELDDRSDSEVDDDRALDDRSDSEVDDDRALADRSDSEVDDDVVHWNAGEDNGYASASEVDDEVPPQSPKMPSFGFEPDLDAFVQ